MVAALRDDALEPQLAGVFKDGRAVVGDVLIILDPYWIPIAGPLSSLASAALRASSGCGLWSAPSSSRSSKA